MRDGEEYVERLLVGLEAVDEKLRRRGRVGIRNIEDESVGENAGGVGEGEGAGVECVLIDLQPLEAPGRVGKRVHVEFEGAFDEAVLGLQILRAQKGALHPDDWLEALHSEKTPSGKRSATARVPGEKRSSGISSPILYVRA